MNIPAKALLLPAFALVMSGCSVLSGNNRPTATEPAPLPPKVEQQAKTSTTAKQEAKKKQTVKKFVAIDEPEILRSLPAGTEVVIRPGAERTIQEYRVNGQLYAIKVTPKIGKPYYLIAVDPAGNIIDPAQRQMLIPSWQILEW